MDVLIVHMRLIIAFHTRLVECISRICVAPMVWLYLIRLKYILDCPRSQPVRHEDRCYPLVGHSAHCLVDQQCSSVQNSICAAGPIEEERTCQCPLDFSLIGRKCIRSESD
jgi:hypothetical protein